MANNDDIQGGLKLADRATLSLLSAFEDETRVTQRSLAKRIGVALGLTNSLLKRALRKGLVKAKDVPAKRYAYFVTPKGFSEKSRLVAEYLTTSLSFFRQAKDEYGELFGSLQASGVKSIALYGVGELAEIAVLVAQEQGMKIQFIMQQGSNQEQFCGYPVRNKLSALNDENVSAVVLTSIEAPQDAYVKLTEIIPENIIHDVPLLHISRNKNAEDDIG